MTVCIVLLWVEDLYRENSMELCTISFSMYCWFNSLAIQLCVFPPRQYYSDIPSCFKASLVKQTFLKPAVKCASTFLLENTRHLQSDRTLQSCKIPWLIFLNHSSNRLKQKEEMFHRSDFKDRLFSCPVVTYCCSFTWLTWFVPAV